LFKLKHFEISSQKAKMSERNYHYRLVPISNLRHLYAANGAIKEKALVNDDGELTEQDKQWLQLNGGPLPSNLIPLSDKALIQQHAHKKLYAQDGSIKLSENINLDGTLSQNDIDWIDNHGGPAPLDMIPLEDRVSIVKIHPISHINDNRDIYHASDNDLDYDEVLNNNNNNNNSLITSTTNTTTSNNPLIKRLYAQDGSIKLSEPINIDGTLQQSDYDWLDNHGGPAPLDTIPTEDRVKIASVHATSHINANTSNNDLNYEQDNNNNITPIAGVPIVPVTTNTNNHLIKRLYAQDGSIKLSEPINTDGTLQQSDIDWLDNHGGPAPLDMIPIEDRVSIVKAHTTSNINDNRDIYHASNNDLDYEQILQPPIIPSEASLQSK
jgi:hypothetical protein